MGVFTLDSKENEIIQPQGIDLSFQYGDDSLKADKLIIIPKRKRHISYSHQMDREWIMCNQEVILEAVVNPILLEIAPRIGAHFLKIAHLLTIVDVKFHYVHVVVAFNRKQSEYAQIWNIFRVGKRYVLYSDGKTRER